MAYSDRIAARLALFSLGNTLLDGTPIDPVKELDPSFATASQLATVNWSVAPTAERCLPDQPYAVNICNGVPTVDRIGARIAGPVVMSSANGHLVSLAALLSDALPAWGILVCGFIVTANDGVEFYGVDILGAEIAGSRRKAKNGQKLIISGPGLFAIAASADAAMAQIIVLTATQELLNDARLVTAVGPAFEPTAPAPAWPYVNQSYLGHVGLAPMDAWQLRQVADALARAGGVAPTSAALDHEVHRRDPRDIWSELRAQSAVQMVADHLDQIRQNPFWTYDAVGGSGTDKLQVAAGPMLQLLARVGPVEALSLGQAVTLPVQRSLELPQLSNDPAQIYDTLWKTGRLPFPLVTVTGLFFDAASKTVVEEFAIAGLDLPLAEGVLDSAELSGLRQPAVLDGAATANVTVWLAHNATAATFFVADGGTDAGLQRTTDSKLPKPFLAPSPDPDQGNPTGQPSLGFGRLDLPLAAAETRPFLLYPRDAFGRWATADRGNYVVTPWPVGAPSVTSLLLEYPADGTVAVRISFQWDRTIRRQATVGFGVRLVVVLPAPNPNGLGAPFDPATDKVSCPAFGEHVELTIGFDAAGNPAIASAAQPPGLSVELVRSVGEPGQLGGPITSSVQAYELRLPLGSADAVFQPVPPKAQLFVQVVADASEMVSGARRTLPPLPQLTQIVSDPRPPVIPSEPWRIVWSGLPNSITGQSRAQLPLPTPAGSGPVATGYHVWRAQETAVLAFVLGWEAQNRNDDFDADAMLAVVRRERNMAIRLSLFQPLIEKYVGNADFDEGFTALFAADTVSLAAADAGPVEILLPARQEGFEFVLFSAVSASGVESGKDPKSLLRVVAVPDRRQTVRPGLRIVTSDDTGAFEMSGLCLAIVSHSEPFSAEAVRFFWGAGDDIVDANQVLQSMTPVSELTMTAAATYVSDVDDLVTPFPNCRYFLLQPAQTTAPHHFTVDLRAPMPTSNIDEIPSPRSSMQTHFVKPLS